MDIKSYKKEVPNIIVGCMRINTKTDKEVETLITTALSCGLNYFDHADIYGKNECETKFAKAIKSLNIDRESIIIQSKAAIRPGICFDFSKKYILESIEGSLKRLNTDYLDFFLFHRPDPLMEEAEVNDILNELLETKKVKAFGVSNQNAHQLNYLNKSCGDRFVINQMQMSITDCYMIDSFLNVNMNNELSASRDGGMWEYSKLHDTTIQAWSPFQHGFFDGVFLDNDKFELLNEEIDNLCYKYNVSNEAIVVAWLLRLPLKMQVVTGTTNSDRLKRISKASNLRLTREEWYRLYMAAGKILP
ncbi:MAG: aldo/keto reductase [Pleomorphochaeta sp.]